jgi:hypothetical protein
MQLATCGPVVAWLTTNPAANTVHLCQHCLDWWFDEADGGDSDEPLAWGWIHQPVPVVLTDEQVVRALTDPRNRAQVARALHLESRQNPAWLRDFLLREELRARYRSYVRAR